MSLGLIVSINQNYEYKIMGRFEKTLNIDIEQLRELVSTRTTSRECARILKCSQNSIMRLMKQNNLKKTVLPIRICPICLVKIDGRGNFCSPKCAGKNGRMKRYKKMEETGIVTYHRLCSIKKYLIDKHGYKCSICENTVWQQVPIPLMTDHVDGKHDNMQLSNYRLICPNCDALLPTFKFKNKGNGNKYRYKNKEAPIVQGIERQSSKLDVAGSIPAGSTKTFSGE